jgi:hypothetical protein
MRHPAMIVVSRTLAMIIALRGGYIWRGSRIDCQVTYDSGLESIA